MLAQYSAAALVADCRRLAVPASADSIPTSAMQEDHVSMGWAAVRKLRRVIDNAVRVVAIEVMTAARAVELRQPLRPVGGHRRRGRRACASPCPGSGRTGSWPPRSTAPPTWSGPARSWPGPNR